MIITWPGYVLHTGIEVVTGEWYHIALVTDGVAKTVAIRVYRESTDEVFTFGTTLGSELTLSNYEWRIGAYNDKDSEKTFDGKIDEVVVFADCLTDGEIDSIRVGIFPNALPDAFAADGSIELSGAPETIDSRAFDTAFAAASPEGYAVGLSIGGPEASFDSSSPGVSAFAADGYIELSGADRLGSVIPPVFAAAAYRLHRSDRRIGLRFFH